MNLTISFNKADAFPAPGEVHISVDILNISPLRSFFHVSLTRLKDGTTDEVQLSEIRSGQFLTDETSAQQRELLKVLGAAVAVSMPAKEETR